MRTLTYVSGPPCVGKSAVVINVQRSLCEIKYVRGDDCWNRYSGLSFDERLARTNQCILESVRSSVAQDILCEWVPCQGQFVNDLHEIAVATGRRFLQVVLTAPVAVLKRRKLERDGDEDIGPEVAGSPPKDKMYQCLLFDTNQVAIPVIADHISKWIQLQHES